MSRSTARPSGARGRTECAETSGGMSGGTVSGDNRGSSRRGMAGEWARWQSKGAATLCSSGGLASERAEAARGKKGRDRAEVDPCLCLTFAPLYSRHSLSLGVRDRVESMFIPSRQPFSPSLRLCVTCFAHLSPGPPNADRKDMQPTKTMTLRKPKRPYVELGGGHAQMSVSFSSSPDSDASERRRGRRGGWRRGDPDENQNG